MNSNNQSSEASDILARISSQVDKVNELEASRLANELSVINERLQKGDYQRFSYTTNVFDVPNRTRDFFTELEFYCLLGSTWAAIFEQLDINNYSVIADLCPGYTPKIELGLFYSSYKGEVVVVDSDNNSISQLQQFMSLFNPSFKITKKVVNLFSDSIGHFDVVLGNHIIDDLILYYYSQKKNIPLSKLYADEKSMKALWNDILDNEDSNVEEVKSLIANLLSNAVKPGGYLCLSQYPSYMERMLGLDKAPAFSKRVLFEVTDALIKQDFISEHEKINKALTQFNGHFTANDCVLLRRK